MEPFAVVVADSTGTIQAWNAEAERLFGYRPGKSSGARLMSSFPSRIKTSTGPASGAS